MSVAAKYENGVFRPLEDVKIEEGTIVEVLVPAKPHSPGCRPSIKDLPFYGIWRDRSDIADGVEFVNRIRKDPRG